LQIGDTALMVAANYGDIRIVKMLLKAGADPSLQAKDVRPSPLVIVIDLA
jgi:ankyrin repeat protein